MDKVSLAFNVGITGHRNLSEDEQESIKRIIYNILYFIKQEVSEVNAIPNNLYKQSDPILRMISMLAEGSDRIAASVALDEYLNYKIQCPLPMKKEEYIKDFSTNESEEEFLRLIRAADSVFEIDNDGKNMATCYLDAGLLMLEHSDVLIAIWDGMDARGIGGTADIISQAERLGIPILWINKNNLKEVCFIYSSKKYYNDWKDELGKYIKQLILPTVEASNTFLDNVNTYLNEECKSKKIDKVYSKTIKIFSYTRKKKTARKNYISISDVVNRSYEDDIKKLVKSYMENYERADYLAVYYADKYRTASIFRVFFPFFATLSLAVGFYWNWANPSNWVNIIGFFLQAVFLLSIILLSSKNERERWHNKYVDYRILAELFRQIIYSAPMGYSTRPIRKLGTEPYWYKGYYRSIVRSVGLLKEKLSNEKMNKYYSLIKSGFIEEQIEYHNEKGEEFSRIAGRLNKIGLLFFIIGIIVTVARVMTYGFIYSHIIPESFAGIKLTSFSNMLSLLFPAIGGFVFSIVSQCGFENLAQKHKLMSSNLLELLKETKIVKDNYHDISALVFRICDLSINEVGEWRSFIKTKSIKKV